MTEPILPIMRTMSAPQAVILLSGGLDSATLMAIARKDGFALHALSFRYGQRHGSEILAAARVAQHFHPATHRIIDLDLRPIAGSALTGHAEIPKDRDPLTPGVPLTYVPARNLIFLACATALAESLAAEAIYIGVNAIDYSGYPDCRPAFIDAFRQAANLATRAGTEGRPIRVLAPLLLLTKPQIIQHGLSLGVDYGLTRSCYDPQPEDRACGRCDSCQLRLRAFRDLNLKDPIPYQS